MFNPEDMLNLSSDNSSFCAIKLSPEEAAYMNYREKELLLLGINIYDFDSNTCRTRDKKYQKYCNLAIRCLDKRKPVPAEIRDYLLLKKYQWGMHPMFNPKEEFKKLEPIIGDECFIGFPMSEEEKKFNIERERIFLELGIDIYSFDDSEHCDEESEKYEDYCEEAVDCVDNHRPIPDEVREYLLREKAKRAGQSQGSPSHLVQF